MSKNLFTLTQRTRAYVVARHTLASCFFSGLFGFPGFRFYAHGYWDVLDDAKKQQLDIVLCSWMFLDEIVTIFPATA